MLADAASAAKYWYFIRLIGRTPSHVVVECALQTHPNVVLVGEEIAARSLTLPEVISEVCDSIELRAADGKNYGAVLLPEGLLQHLAHFRHLISELNMAVAAVVTPGQPADEEAVVANLTPWSAALYESLPASFRKGLLRERESGGTIQLTQIETERLVADLCGEELARRKAAGSYAGKFSAVTHFFGYQGRSSLPSRLDASLGYVSGYAAGLLGAAGQTGVTVSVRGLCSPVAGWRVGCLPLTALLSVDNDVNPWGVGSARVRASNVDVKSASFRRLMAERVEWVREDRYRNPGPIQFSGAAAQEVFFTCRAEHEAYLANLGAVERACKRIKNMCVPFALCRWF